MKNKIYIIVEDNVSTTSCEKKSLKTTPWAFVGKINILCEYSVKGKNENLIADKVCALHDEYMDSNNREQFLKNTNGKIYIV